MRKVDRTSPLTIAAFAAVGLAIGLVVQFFRSSRGMAPLVPPTSLPITLVVLAAAILTLGLVLRHKLTRDTGGNINPFIAVQILAAARASQFAGAVFGGFGAGLILSLVGRSVPAPTPIWAPMVFVIGAGVVLLICGIVTERLCRIPPDDGSDEERSSAADEEFGAEGLLESRMRSRNH
ncbi:MAG: DUF3180 domain-containing protein [Leucobacter sp.]